MRTALATLPAQIGVACVVNFGTDALAAALAVAAPATLALGIRRRAKLPPAPAAVSLPALVVAGSACAAGYDAAGACGGA